MAAGTSLAGFGHACRALANPHALAATAPSTVWEMVSGEEAYETLGALQIIVQVGSA